MKKLLLCLLAILLHTSSYAFSCCQGTIPTDSINDGPYIFKENHRLFVKYITNGLLADEYLTLENFDDLQKRFFLKFDYEYLLENNLKKVNYSQNFTQVDSIAVISDIHGEFSKYIGLLKGTEIIDSSLNWQFGKGHLVVLGDIFDKGDKITEVLWHLFGLKMQAESSGGKVHVVLGNHDIMALSCNSEFTNEKYKKVEAITGNRYCDLYKKNTVLGNWLRSWPVIITINNIIFVHGGISPELVKENMSIIEINRLFSERITGKTIKKPDPTIDRKDYENKTDPFISDQGLSNPVSSHSAEKIGIKTEPDYELGRMMLLLDNEGPLWYRGYFSDKEFNENDLDAVLGYYKKQHIVVGHTTRKDIDIRFNFKLFGVDAGIGIDQPGSVLIFKGENFYKGYSNGIRIRLN